MTGRRRPLPSALLPAVRSRTRWCLLFALGAALIWSGLPLPPATAAADDLGVERQIVDASGGTDAQFAQDTAVDGDWMAVLSDRGGSERVDVLHRSGTSWPIDRTITVTGRVTDLALSGSTLAVAEQTSTTGQVSLYSLTDESAPPQVVPAPADLTTPRDFARSIALAGGRLVVGLDNSGAPRLYDRQGAGWPTSATATLPTTTDFTSTVAIEGQTITIAELTSLKLIRKIGDQWTLVDTVRGFAPEFSGADTPVLAGSSAVFFLTTSKFTPNSPVALSRVVVRRKLAGRWSDTQTIAIPEGLAAGTVSGNTLAVLDRRGRSQLFQLVDGTWTPGPWTSLSGERPEDFAGDNARLQLNGSRVIAAQPSFDRASAGVGRLLVLRTGLADPQLPKLPTGLTVTASATTGTATVRWRGPSGSAVTRYRVRAVSGIDILRGAEEYRPGTARSYTFTGLEQFGPYRFVVQPIGPGGEGPAAVSGEVRMGGPTTSASPYLLRDAAGDVSDERSDVVSLTGEANGDHFTVRVRPKAARDPYTDAFFRQPGDGAIFRVDLETPVSRSTIFQHRTNNMTAFLEGEDFTFRFLIPRPCKNAIFPARLVDGAYQASIPSRCFDHGRALRISGSSRRFGGDPDFTETSPPIRRVVSKGNVTIDPAKVSSTTLWAKSDGKIKISVTARHWSGIKKARLMPFALSNGTRPVRVGATTCRAKNKTTSTCSATFVVRPGEVRDLDSGLWRAFAQVEAKNGAAGVEENAATFSVRRGNELTGKATFTGERVSVTGHLRGARWSSRGYADLKDRPVELQLKARGTSTFTTVREVKTDDAGDLAVSVSTRLKGSWRLKFAATKTYAGRTVSVGRTG